MVCHVCWFDGGVDAYRSQSGLGSTRRLAGRCCFFFSSRRRHTRCSRDWSSDVCSSDLDRNCSRGGPPVRIDPYLSAWAEVDGDGRPALVPNAWFNYWRGDGGRSESFNGNVQGNYRVASQVNTSLTLKATHTVSAVQPLGPR